MDLFVYGTTAVALVVSGLSLWATLRSTPARVVSRCRQAEEAAESACEDAARLRTEWTTAKVEYDTLLAAIESSAEKLGRTRRKVMREAERAERAMGGMDGDPVAAKAAALRAAGWEV